MIAEDRRERWETIDHPVVHKIQDINESVFKETNATMSFKEVRRRDPYDTVAHPSLYFLKYLITNNIFLICIFKGETEELEKYCSLEIVERCKAQHKICDMQGTFYDNKILHISKVEMPDLIVDYDMSKRTFSVVHQEEVVSHDGTIVPLTILYSHKAHKMCQSCGIIHGYGSYGEVLDKSWSAKRLSLLDRNWVVAFADVRGGGGADLSWHKSGSGLNKLNTINDFISCGNYLI
ncbi:protease 2-like protein isoform X1, partial [Tanacetum coccineum]